MTHTVELQYFFDPFCGWCYASAPALRGIAAKFPGQLRMMPSGLFFENRPVSTMADHAWRNDQRIQALTGQPFSETYHRKVLLAPKGVFSSAAATLALQAVGGLGGALEPALLHALQIARYVDGRDTANEEEVARVAVEVAHGYGFELTAHSLANTLRTDTQLRAGTLKRMRAVQARMDELGIRGVPQLVAVINGTATVLNGEMLYHGPARLIAAIQDLIRAA